MTLKQKVVEGIGWSQTPCTKQSLARLRGLVLLPQQTVRGSRAALSSRSLAMLLKPLRTGLAWGPTVNAHSDPERPEVLHFYQAPTPRFTPHTTLLASYGETCFQHEAGFPWSHKTHF